MTSSMNRLKKSSVVASAFNETVGWSSIGIVEIRDWVRPGSVRFIPGKHRSVTRFTEPQVRMAGTHRRLYRLLLSNSEKRTLPSLSESVSDELMLESLIISKPKPLPRAQT